MTHPYFLQQYQKLLRSDGALYLKHDNRTFFDWSVEQLRNEKWNVVELSHDLHESDLSEDCKIMTTYEQRWLGEGLATHFVRAELAG